MQLHTVQLLRVAVSSSCQQQGQSGLCYATLAALLLKPSFEMPNPQVEPIAVGQIYC